MIFKKLETILDRIAVSGLCSLGRVKHLHPVAFGTSGNFVLGSAFATLSTVVQEPRSFRQHQKVSRP